MAIIKTQDEVIKKFVERHGDKYDYSKVKYTGSKNKLCIICPRHGEFSQHADNHYRYGCKKCSNEYRGNNKRLDINTLLKAFRSIHVEQYDYSKVTYINTDINICIICPIHGEFFQLPKIHKNGGGCPKCAIHFSTMIPKSLAW